MDELSHSFHDCVLTKPVSDTDLYLDGRLTAGTALEKPPVVASEPRLEDPAAVAALRDPLRDQLVRPLETRLRDLIAAFAEREDHGTGARRHGVLGVLGVVAPAEEGPA